MCVCVCVLCVCVCVCEHVCVGVLKRERERKRKRAIEKERASVYICASRNVFGQEIFLKWLVQVIKQSLQFYKIVHAYLAVGS